MTARRIEVCVFDAYGTLFDVHSAVARHAGDIGPDAAAISRLWRAKQLEYSWVRTLIGRHADFWTVTQQALDVALATHGRADGDLRRRLLAAYLELDAYPEVPAVLRRLKGHGLRTAILSNGSPEMLAAAVAAAGLGPLLDTVLSIEEVGIYKPNPRVYRLAVDRLGVAPAAVSFQSSNQWDAAGAAAFGFEVIAVDRSGEPPEYGWVLEARRIPDLAALPALVGAG